MAHSNLVQSLERGLAIIDLVARSGSGLTLTEIMEAVQLKRPTAFNLTKTLVVHRYLEKSGRPVRFLLGPAALEAVEAWRHREMARQFGDLVKDLAAAIAQSTVVLAEPLGGEVIAVHLVEKNRPGVVQHSSTRRLTPYVHASTLCLMAFWPPAELAAYEARYPFQEYGAGVWGPETKLDAFLEAARRQGHVAWEGPDSRFLVGAPVYSAEGALLAAVGVSVTMNPSWGESKKSAIVAQVKTAVGRLRPGSEGSASPRSAPAIA
jgi:IclR family KDG regulon transcriptional repressor